MVKSTPTAVTQKRKPRVLWANPYCLLDTSSGASMTVRQMLLQLVSRGYEVQVLGATVFDNPKGMGRLKEQCPDLNTHLHQLIEAEDGPLTHQLLVSYSHNRNHLTTHEEGLWYSQYLYMLDSFKPDVVWFYGGQTLDMLIAADARDRGIPVAFYLANGNYKAPYWCRDVDLILTDSQATAEMYRKEVGFFSKPVGKFIAPESFIAEQHERQRLLFVNPSWQKGASVFIQLAEKLERERPDIELEVVEARADWPAVLRETTRKMGEQRSALSNVVVTPNTSDMRDPYSRARMVVAPSLWWESSGRMLAEAMLNGIPALITNRGGMPEMICDAGFAFDFPDECYKEPYQHLLSDEELQPLVEAVTRFFDDEDFYQEYVDRAWRVGKEKHHLDHATERLITALTPLVNLRAGNKDFAITQKKRHRQRLASRATKPEFKVDNSLQQLIGATSRAKQDNELQANRLCLTDDFTWQIKGKIMVLDNRASLIKSGLADQMAATQAFGIVAFDPASEIKDTKQYEGSDYIQLFQHALLGDGKATTLHACVAPEMTSTLTPLSAEKLPQRHHLGAKPLAEMPINTVALDSIDGLGNLDWLILDELSDAMAVLEHGKKSLTDTLLIQARVAFQLTHEKQPSLAELQHWASRNGFRFYRFHNISHYSHLPEKLSAKTACATEQESGDVLFLPSHERMTALNEKERMKLAFILSAGFAAHDVAFDLIADVSQEKALEFLEAQKLLPKSPSQNGSSISTIEDLKVRVAKAPLALIKANHSLPGHLVVSLTSYKARFANLHLTLRSLLLQEMCPDLLILWIAEDEKADLPEAVWQLEQYGLNIHFCEDIRSYKKIIPTLKEYPDSFIVTADDDIYYEPKWLEELLNSWDGDNNTIVAHRAHKIRFDKKGNPLPYRQWKWEVGSDEHSDGLIFPTSGAGTLYPPHIFHSDVTNKARFMELCPSADDIWLYWMASLNGAKVKCSNYDFKLTEWPSQDSVPLWKENVQGGSNDKQIVKISKAYGEPWHIFKKSMENYFLPSERQGEFVFIVGCGRSGNTLMRRLLMEKFDIFIPPETYILPSQIKWFYENSSKSWKEKVEHFLLNMEKSEDFESFGVSSLNGFGEEAKNWPVGHQCFETLVSELYKWLGKENSVSACWVGDKTPFNTLHLPILNKAFPKAKFIFMERDPFDVVASYLESGIYKDPKKAINRWTVSCEEWNKFCKIKDERNRVTVSYESLVEDFESEIDVIGRKFGIPLRNGRFDFSVLGDVMKRKHHDNVRKPVFSSSVGRGKKALRNEVIEVIKKEIENLNPKN